MILIDFLILDFIEICNLLQLKATISCERKLVFDKPVTTDAFAPSTSTALAITGSQHAASDNVDSNTTNVTRQQNLDSLIADLEETPKFNDDGDDEDSSYELKDKDIQEPNQILEVYEISNIEEDMTYEDEDMESEEHYELMNVIEPKVETSEPKSVKKKECKTDTMEYYEVSEIKPRIPAKQVDEEILNAALGEIIANTSSFRVVSEKYGIPKTLLWRRAKKIGYIKGEKQKDSNRLQAIEAIKHGESLISLSKRFNIPISTLHREKLKLFENGQLPDSVNLKNRSRGEDFDDRMRNALAEILNGKSQNEVAKKYKIPKTTLWRLLRKMAPATKPDNVLVAADSDVVTQLLTQSKKRQSIKEEIDDSDQIPLKILST